ncbi:MAG: hypothetical protein ACIAQZ_01135 [Sedimentisphaeraceae bacterium JB056]
MFRIYIQVVLLILCGCSFAVLDNPYTSDVSRYSVSADGVEVFSEIRSKPTVIDEAAEYIIQLTNTADKAVEVEIMIEASEKNISEYELSNDLVEIEAGAQFDVKLSVSISKRMPVGSFEELELRIKVGNDTSMPLSFKTVRMRPHPYLLITNELADEILNKIDNYEWADDCYDELLKQADKITFKELNYPKMSRSGYNWQGLISGGAERFWDVALAYKLTGNEKYKKTLIDFLRAIAEPDTGYPTTRWATHSTAYVHEGEFFTFYPAIYDILYNEPELSEMDHKNIDTTLRLYLETSKQWHVNGDIGNWLTTANAGALITSLVLQDMESFEFFINCENGFDEQLSYGIMADGWWLEGASNYSYLVARFYGYVAKAADNWGINLFDKRVVARHQSNDGRRFKNGWMSMNFDIWGPAGKSYRCLKDLYDGATILMDENGYVVANNDSEKKKPGDVFELAYYYYKDPQYAWMISKDDRMGWQSLVYGVGELPEVDDPRDESGYVANVGITALRSQGNKTDKQQQIQAFVKWGSHGGWHGHFDRTSFLALRRFGTDLFEPRASWFGYSSQMYKAWVEPSISHNLVIVDEYQQEPVESEQTLFYAGDDIQVSVVETVARWQEKQSWDITDPGDLDPENMAKMIDYGDNEPVLQRRLMAVADDYVVVADYLEGQNKHTFDWLMHPEGFVETVGNAVNTGYSAKMKDDKLSSYYYITNCDRFDADGHIVNRFKDENLNLDIHTFLDESTDMTVGTYPFNLCRQPVKVLVDGKEVFNENYNIYSSNIYDLNIDVSGAKELEIIIGRRTHSSKNRPGEYIAMVRPAVVSKGKVIPLSELDYKTENIQPADYGRDYYGDKINIAGIVYENAMMTEPSAKEGSITINLEGQGAEKFTASIGADHLKTWNEFERKTLQFRREGKDFKLISVFEPYKDKSAIKSAVLLDNDVVRVELNDGTTELVEIDGLSNRDGENIRVSFAKMKNGKLIDKEIAENKKGSEVEN